MGAEEIGSEPVRTGQPGFGERLAGLTMPAIAGLFAIAMVRAVWIAYAWPLVHDAPLIHYVVFLMQHGRAPYRDIVEMNMPGTYILEWIAMHVFGGGAAGWWRWDAVSGLAIVLAGAWIAGPGRRSAGVAGGVYAYLFHLSTGPWDMGQRDWVMAVIFALAIGFLFAGVRDRRPVLMAGFGFMAAAASMIKPPIFISAILFLAGAYRLVRREGTVGVRMIAWSALGAVVPIGLVAGFLLHWGATRDFLATLDGIVPWYASLHRLSEPALLRKALPNLFFPLCAGAVVLFAWDGARRRWESLFLIALTLCGTVLFVTQGKGWSYHLGLETVGLCLWGMLELERGLRTGGFARIVAWVALAAVMVGVPGELKTQANIHYPMGSLVDLESDLSQLGGPALSGHVQCLDMVLGSCINVLYRMKLVQSTGFIYGFYLFPREPNAVTRPLQERFLSEVEARPPRVIVLSADMWPEERYGYDEIEDFPAFSQWLQQRYRIVKVEPQTTRAAGYRIYVLNDPRPA
jgi:hypothetical protein